MTQLGRYAEVAKRPLDRYQVVQDTSFSLPHALSAKEVSASSRAVDTQVFIRSQASVEKTQTMLQMGEQTCYLHAACRTAIKTRIHTAKI